MRRHPPPPRGASTGDQGVRAAIRELSRGTIGQQDVDTDDPEGKPRVLFRSVAAFDHSQVDPLDGAQAAPLHAPSQPLTGDTHAHLRDPAAAFATSLGYTIAFESTPTGVGGWCDRAARRIVVDADAPANAQLRTLIHETAHALDIDYHAYTRERAEVMVDTITHIICAGLGLAIDGEPVPYVAGWGEHGALDAVNQFAGTIDQLARRIENAITTAPAATATAA